ncbi:permease prefix domain 1-containing protein [Streptomyces sp. NBC_00234]|uniref:permease prefix domain 1-containing protein n=1 Tax=Streptomyces sp. NBC_00234 TaxID=2903638 RepID=UPI002E2D5D8E|nr:permease prefix domain 1-containing protein [Streptomyces sp. NBC_00234]
MNATGRHADPIRDHVAALTAALYGPARAKARLIEEMRGGLTDTAEAYTAEGMPYERAADRAVREFGTVDVLVPSCQQELTTAQARHTARAVALTAPFLIVCWHLARTADREQAWQFSHAAQLLAAHLAGIAAVAALLAAATLAATGPLARRLPTPHRLPLLVAWAGTTASTSMAVTTLALATASALATNWPLLAFAGALAAVSHAAVAASARACRRCARLSV